MLPPCEFSQSTKVASAEIHREAIAVPGEQAGLYVCVVTRIITLALTVGNAVWPGCSQELPLPYNKQSRPQLSTVCLSWGLTHIW